MMNTKHATNCVEAGDGLLAWVEPVGVTKDLQEWRLADGVMSIRVPPRDLTGRLFQRGE